jgi:hypothetical protein
MAKKSTPHSDGRGSTVRYSDGSMKATQDGHVTARTNLERKVTWGGGRTDKVTYDGKGHKVSSRQK